MTGPGPNGWGGDTASPRGPAQAGFGEQGTFALFRDVLNTALGLAKGEMQLLKTEMKASLRSLLTGAVGLGIALLAGGAAINFIGLAAVGGLLEADLPLWAAALIVAGALLAIVVVAVLIGINAIKSASAVPHQTLNNLRRDFDAVSAALQAGKGNHDARQ